MPIRTRFRVHKKPIEETKPQRQCTMIRRDVLTYAVGPGGCRTSTKDGEHTITVSLGSVTGRADVAENLVVRTVLLDDVDDVLDRRATIEERSPSWAK